MNVQIVVPTINLWEKYTKGAIESIQQSAEQAKLVGVIDDYRILLIDNASTDETLIEAGKLVSEYFCHQRNEDQWGFQKSVNFGVNDAFTRGYEYVLVCNNDILLHPNTITNLVERLSNSEAPDVVMVTGLNIRGECVTPEALKDKVSADWTWSPESEHPDFSCFMVNKRCWDEVGEMDELFAPAYFEDNDYHYRINRSENKAITFPQAIYYHYGSRTQVEALGRPLMSHPQFDNNRALYTKKWGGSPGEEAYMRPYNDPLRSIRNTKQEPLL